MEPSGSKKKVITSHRMLRSALKGELVTTRNGSVLRVTGGGLSEEI